MNHAIRLTKDGILVINIPGDNKINSVIVNTNGKDKVFFSREDIEKMIKEALEYD